MALFQDLRSGSFTEDPELLLCLARAHFMEGSAKHDAALLRPLAAGLPARFSPEASLLYARVLESMGQTTEAETAYAKAVESAAGLEPLYRQAVFFARTGRPSNARQNLDKVLARAKEGGKIFRRFEREWIKRAKSARANFQT